MANLYKADGTILEVQPKNGTDFSLDELQESVGGYVQIVQLDEDLIMCMNEDGKICGLPINYQATTVFSLAVGFTSDFIVGDALVCERAQVK